MEYSHHMQSTSVPLIESYRSVGVGGDGAAFHWGSGCVSNMTWNDTGTVHRHCNCGKIRLHHDIILHLGRKAVLLLYFTAFKP